MLVQFASINSGSNGNCYYVGNANEAVLIDVGIHCREVEKRMLRMGLSCKKIKAIFVSHEHSDHIRGVYTLANKYAIPVFINAGTLNNSAYNLNKVTKHIIQHQAEYTIGDLTIVPFAKQHDAADPISFVVKSGTFTVGVITDIGIACENVKQYAAQCDALFLEANYDEQMLNTGKYPYYLKQRIKGGKGHVSNAQALELFVNHCSKNLKHLILSHLSKENNNPDLVFDFFKQHMGQTQLVIASRYNESNVFTLSQQGFQETKPLQAVIEFS